jgi:membrane protein
VAHVQRAVSRRRGVLERVDSCQRRHPVLGFPLGVVYKFVDDRGPHLAALISYYGFVSLFPLLLLLTSVLGYLLEDDPALQQRVLDSALSNFPLLQPQLEQNIGGFRGSGVALVVGIAGTLYGALGVMQAAQAALNRIYAVPRFAQPNPLASRGRSLLLVAGLGLGALLATGLSALVPRVTDLLPSVGVLAPLGTTLVTLAINTGIFLMAFRALTARHLGWRDVLVGALIAAVLWQLLQTLGVSYFGSYLNRQSDVYGVFGVVLGLIVWIYLQALVVVIAAEINVVRQHRLFPRALLTPFTDHVDLTDPDIRAYTDYARSERYKAFERVEATFQREVGTDSPPREDRTGGPSGHGQG